MNKVLVSAIVALGEKTRAIGKNGELIWQIAEDLKRFKQLTTGHTVVMGRKTFESIHKMLGRPLPNRTNIVVTRNPDSLVCFNSGFFLKRTDVNIAITDAMRLENDNPQKEVFIIGGGEIYRVAWPRIQRIYLTIVEDDALADTFFPEYDKDFSKIIDFQTGTCPKTELRFRFETRERF